MFPRNLIRSVLALTFAALLGCSQDKPDFADVEGTVTLNGKPLPNAEIVFLADIEKGKDRPASSSYTDEQGHYRLWSQQAKQHGAAIGRYRVCVHDIAAMPLPPLETPTGGPEDKGHRPQPLRVPSRYSDVSQTPFQGVEVRPGQMTLDFDVKTASR